MKKNAILIAFLLVVLASTGCKSKVQKAEKLIKTELSKTLYDFDSYKPIETTVVKTNVNAFNDSACWNKASVLAYAFSKLDEYIEDAEEAKSHMEIWGRPTYYSSTYSDNRWYQYREEFNESVANINITIATINIIANELKDLIAKLDTTQLAGWEVQHSFRCNTRGGHPEIGHFRYVISKDLKTIILEEDTESKEDKKTRELLENVLNGWTDLEPIEL